MMCEERFVLTDLPSDGDADGMVTTRTRRCRGCARCISTEPGRCDIDDDLTPLIERILANETLEIRTETRDSQFAMPMRKAMERLGNVLQSYTDAGGNTPLDISSVRLRCIIVKVRGETDSIFEDNARKMLLKGPVRSIRFDA